MVKKVLLATLMICFTVAFVCYSLFVAMQPSIGTTELIIAVILAAGSMTFAMLHVTNSDKKE